MSLVRGIGGVIRLSDGSETRLDLPGTFGPTSALASVSYDPNEPAVQVMTTSGDAIHVRLPRSQHELPPFGGPVGYLDQNQWSQVANYLHDRDRVPPDQLAATAWLIERARSGEVVLPMSAGHLSETCRWGNDQRRYRLGLTIAQLSGGWVMHDPVALRRFELRQALTIRWRGMCLRRPDPFSLRSETLLARDDRDAWVPPADLPAPVRFHFQQLTTVSAHLDTLLDGVSEPSAPQHGWVDKWQATQDQLADTEVTPSERQRIVNAKFIGDIAGELQDEAGAVGLTEAQIHHWIDTDSDADFKAAPALGLFREVLREKLHNPTTVWRPNDLADMFYLAAAGGYADHVVGERNHITHLRNGIRRLERGANVHRSLTALYEALQ